MFFYKNKKFINFIFAINIVFLCFIAISIFYGFQKKSISKLIETEELVIRNSKTSEVIYLGFSKENHPIAIFGEKGENKIKIELGKNPGIYICDKNDNSLGQLTLDADGNSTILLNNSKKVPSFIAKGGDVPSIFLKNRKNKTVASLTVLNDDGGGVGFADPNGIAATVLRGGKSPGLAFYLGKDDPLAAIGVMNSVPHMLISGNSDKEGILIHGGKQAGLMVVDEKGQVKFLISKHGVFQGKEKQEPERAPEKEKFFSNGEDGKLLFPDQDLFEDSQVTR
jgi:hypothetical protein